MRFSVSAELLTNAYFGEIKPLASGIFADTLSMPTIYTFAGALFTRLLEKGVDINDIIKKSSIYGIYLLNNKECFIPITPFALEYRNNQRILRLDEKDYKEITNNYATTYNINSHLRLYMPTFNLNKEDLKKQFYIHLNSLNEGAIIKELDISLVKEERTRVALNYERKVAEEERLFSFAILSKTNLSYCIDVELPFQEDIVNIDKWIGHFGGESTLARFRVCKETPLLNIIRGKSSNRYIAVSHIALKSVNNSLICKLGKIRYIIGRVEMLGGWDIANNMSKKIYACIEPGSIFCIDDSNIVINEDKWYFDILSVAIPI